MMTPVRVAKIITFTACREIQRLPRTNPPEYVLIAPSINWWSVAYPASVQMGLFVEFTEAAGAYVPRIDVYDAEGDLLSSLIEGDPFVSNDPVAVHSITLERVRFEVPRPGLYDLVLSFNKEEAARRQFWVRPPNWSASSSGFLNPVPMVGSRCSGVVVGCRDPDDARRIESSRHGCHSPGLENTIASARGASRS
jgi:hypothetical protein